MDLLHISCGSCYQSEELLSVIPKLAKKRPELQCVSVSSEDLAFDWKLIKALKQHFDFTNEDIYEKIHISDGDSRP